MFTFGTGIGGGIVIDGLIMEGRHSHGAECGHIIVQMENARQCSCGAYGHLEGYASATALVKRRTRGPGAGRGGSEPAPCTRRGDDHQSSDLRGRRGGRRPGRGG